MRCRHLVALMAGMVVHAMGSNPSHALFCGVRSLTHDRVNLERAQRAQSARVKPEIIWELYGWHLASDDKWRCEIDDLPAIVKFVSPQRTQFRLDEILHHPDLYAAYPELASTPVKFVVSPLLGQWAHKTILISHEQRTDELRLGGTILHEIQHAIQDIEGFRYARYPIWERYEFRRGELEAEAADTRWKLLPEVKRWINPHVRIDAHSN